MNLLDKIYNLLTIVYNIFKNVYQYFLVCSLCLICISVSICIYSALFSILYMCLSDPENFFQFLFNNYKIINMVIDYPIVQWIILFCFYVFIQSIVLFGVNFIKNIFLYFLSIEFLLKSNQNPITI